MVICMKEKIVAEAGPVVLRKPSAFRVRGTVMRTGQAPQPSPLPTVPGNAAPPTVPLSAPARSPLGMGMLLLQLCPDAPMRPPDYRWRLARLLVDEGIWIPRPRKVWSDAWVEQAWQFI